MHNFWLALMAVFCGLFMMPAHWIPLEWLSSNEVEEMTTHFYLLQQHKPIYFFGCWFFSSLAGWVVMSAFEYELLQEGYHLREPSKGEFYCLTVIIITLEIVGGLVFLQVGFCLLWFLAVIFVYIIWNGAAPKQEAEPSDHFSDNF